MLSVKRLSHPQNTMRYAPLLRIVSVERSFLWFSLYTGNNISLSSHNSIKILSVTTHNTINEALISVIQPSILVHCLPPYSLSPSLSLSLSLPLCIYIHTHTPSQSEPSCRRRCLSLKIGLSHVCAGVRPANVLRSRGALGWANHLSVARVHPLLRCQYLWLCTSKASKLSSTLIFP